jgi:hypothetical protein
MFIRMKKEKKDTYSYKGWMLSDNIIKRAFGVYGHSLLAALMIMIPIYVLMFIIMGAIWAIS